MYGLGRTMIVLGFLLVLAGAVILGFNRLNLALWATSRRLHLARKGLVSLFPPGNLNRGQYFPHPPPLDHRAASPVALQSTATMLDSAVWQMARTNRQPWPICAHDAEKFVRGGAPFRPPRTIVNAANPNSFPMNSWPHRSSLNPHGSLEVPSQLFAPNNRIQRQINPPP